MTCSGSDTDTTWGMFDGRLYWINSWKFILELNWLQCPYTAIYCPYIIYIIYIPQHCWELVHWAFTYAWSDKSDKHTWQVNWSPASGHKSDTTAAIARVPLSLVFLAGKSCVHNATSCCYRCPFQRLIKQLKTSCANSAVAMATRTLQPMQADLIVLK